MPGPVRTRRALLAVALTAMTTAAIAPAAASAKRVGGPGFATQSPSGWKVKRSHADGWSSIELSSPGARGRALARTVRITVSSISARRFLHKTKHGAPSDPSRLVKMLQGVPSKAQQIALLAPPTPTALAGEAAAYTSVSYTYRSTSLIQHDTAIKRHGRVYLINLLGDASYAPIGMTALTTVVQRWRWR